MTSWFSNKFATGSSNQQQVQHTYTHTQPHSLFHSSAQPIAHTHLYLEEEEREKEEKVGKKEELVREKQWINSVGKGEGWRVGRSVDRSNRLVSPTSPTTFNTAPSLQHSLTFSLQFIPLPHSHSAFKF
ncbi:hypothetical protein Pmani_030657 [Petrolisthes manimaculis]|uniref:Uncharacterized protein n=1 Tax=Petrolisthes manimaculis TaxID=1843537 RepID=A0AAE1TVP7_9EUCA|nr:hypothetical protein Pmani_030657 [Petrolisthes manimaculis]